MFLITLSLTSAVMMGAGDFFGGLATKKSPVALVGLITQLLGLLIVGALLLCWPNPFAQVPFFFGLAAGCCGSVALMCLYKGLAVGKVSIVAPVSAVLSALIPVLVSVVTGHAFQPITWAGILSGLVGVYFLSLPSEEDADSKKETGIVLAIAAGIALACFYMLLGNEQTHGNIWTLFAERISVVTVMLVVVLCRRLPLGKSIPGFKLMLAAGATDVLGNLAFLYSSSIGPLPMVALISSLYPAATIFLGWLILKESLNPRIIIGIICAFVCIVIFGIQ